MRFFAWLICWLDGRHRPLGIQWNATACYCQLFRTRDAA